jgi:hypothetical protein
MAERLGVRGSVQSEEAGGNVLIADLATVPEPAPPAGYELAWVADDADVHQRVESHRAAFAPSDLTLPMYRRVRRTWPYRPELDRIVKTSEGEIAACWLAWLDERNTPGCSNPSQLTRRVRIAVSAGLPGGVSLTICDGPGGGRAQGRGPSKSEDRTA